MYNILNSWYKVNIIIIKNIKFHIFPISLNEQYPFPAMIKKSNIPIPIIFPASFNRSQVCSSSLDGFNDPEGWLWTSMIAVALLNIAALNTSRGWTIDSFTVPIVQIWYPTTWFWESKQKTMNISWVWYLRSLCEISITALGESTLWILYLWVLYRIFISRIIISLELVNTLPGIISS